LSDRGDDIASITELLALYTNRLDRSDHRGWAELFTPDGRFEVYGRAFEGTEGLVSMSEAAPNGLHLSGAPIIKLEGDQASVQQSFLFVDQVTRESRIGFYDDQLTRTPKGWRFAVRRSTFLTPKGASDRP
jgi:hypothetical protein